MSVYLTLNEINDIAKRFNGKFISGWFHCRLCIFNNKNEPIPILRFKKQEGNTYKIWLFNDVFHHWRADNSWTATYETSNYGKPKTKEEFYNRLDMLSKNMVKIKKTVKEWAIKQKEIKLNEDFND